MENYSLWALAFIVIACGSPTLSGPDADGGTDADSSALVDGGTDAASSALVDGGTDAASSALVDGGTDAGADAAPTGPNSITIVVDAQPDDVQVFPFTTVGVNLYNFDLDDDGNIANANSNTKTFSNLPSGAYRITQAPSPGWTTAGTGYQGTINCSDTGTGSHSTFTPTTNSVIVTFSAGNIPNVTCRFINTR